MTEQEEDILHSGRLGKFSASSAKYTSSIDIDSKLMKPVIAINMAHVISLARKKIIDSGTARKLLRALARLPPNLKLREVLEDVHMNVEDSVIKNVGKSIGGMLNLAKSRNDQVATALRMALREEFLLLGDSLLSMQGALLDQAAKHAGTVMPGYTHLQRAQPVTVGHNLLAHYDALDRDFGRIVDCYLRVNNSPMGSGALAGSSFELDREFEARLLGFDSVVENSLDAVSSRDFATESIYVCAQIMIDLSRLSEETILWTTKEFSFAEISDKYSSTSSMMPQKKNAIVPEIARAKSSQVVGDLVGALSIERALPLSYNLDLQELTRNLWSAFEKTISSLQMLSEMMREIKFNSQEMLGAVSSDNFLYATELADYLVRTHKLSFREAHGRVGALVKHASSLGLNENQFFKVNQADMKRILGVPITTSEISEITDPRKVLAKRHTVGSPNPTLVSSACRKRKESLRLHEKTINAFRDKIIRSQESLDHFSKLVGSEGRELARVGASQKDPTKVMIARTGYDRNRKRQSERSRSSVQEPDRE